MRYIMMQIHNNSYCFRELKIPYASLSHRELCRHLAHLTKVLLDSTPTRCGRGMYVQTLTTVDFPLENYECRGRGGAGLLESARCLILQLIQCVEKTNFLTQTPPDTSSTMLPEPIWHELF